MNAADEVVIDEMRLPSMFRRLRRAGLYRRCNCAGCPPCIASARQLLRGVAARPQSMQPYLQDPWGERFRLFSRLVGPRMIDVLADMSGPPTIVDVNVRPAADAAAEPAADAPQDADADADAGDAGEGEVSLRALLARKIPAEANVGGKLQTVPDIPFSRPFALDEIGRRGGLAQLPAGPGLYLVQWRNGQYLGIAASLRGRIAQHVDSLRRLVHDPSHYSFHVAAVGGDPRLVEKQVLTALSNLVGTARDPVAARLKRLGLTNRQREIGLP